MAVNGGMKWQYCITAIQYCHSYCHLIPPMAILPTFMLFSGLKRWQVALKCPWRFCQGQRQFCQALPSTREPKRCLWIEGWHLLLEFERMSHLICVNCPTIQYMIYSRWSWHLHLSSSACLFSKISIRRR